MKFKFSAFLLLAPFAIILASGCVKTPNDGGLACKQGFISDFSDQNNPICYTEKKEFECIGNILATKGFYVCNHLIDTQNLPQGTTIDSLKEMADSNVQVKVKGKTSDSYIVCTGKEIDLMRATACNVEGSSIVLESIEAANQS